eukprot:SAG31_NODE_6160_length_2143_cov_2.173679_2_plen_113_part_01
MGRALNLVHVRYQAPGRQQLAGTKELIPRAKRLAKMPVVSSRPPLLLLLALSTSSRFGIEMAAADTTLPPTFSASTRLGGTATAVARCALAADAQQMRHSLPVGEALELATVP